MEPAINTADALAPEGDARLLDEVRSLQVAFGARQRLQRELADCEAEIAVRLDRLRGVES